MACWLLKTEPEVFSFTDLERVGREPWNGVRNYQARNNLRAMQAGDLCLIYHSNARPAGVVGVARIVREAYPDDLQFNPASPYFDPKSAPTDPRWSMVDVSPVCKLPRLVSLERLRELPAWESSPLTSRGTRLSVIPVTEPQFEAVLHEVGWTSADLI